MLKKSSSNNKPIGNCGLISFVGFKLNNDEFLQKIDMLSNELLITQEQLSIMTQISIPTLERDRYAGKGIPFYKHKKLVRYKLGDVRKYLAENTFNSTTESQVKNKQRLMGLSK